MRGGQRMCRRWKMYSFLTNSGGNGWWVPWCSPLQDWGLAHRSIFHQVKGKLLQRAVLLSGRDSPHFNLPAFICHGRRWLQLHSYVENDSSPRIKVDPHSPVSLSQISVFALHPESVSLSFLWQHVVVCWRGYACFCPLGISLQGGEKFVITLTWCILLHWLELKPRF